MALVKKSISLTDQQDAWIKARIASGDYGNESEVVRDLIRKEQARASEAQAIRAALIQGEQSGVGARTPEDVRRSVRRRLRERGDLPAD